MMRGRLTRIALFAIIVFGLGFGVDFYLNNFSGDGKATSQEALPIDGEYQWIKGPKSEKAQRYFFFADGKYFGTELLTENYKGWSHGLHTSARLPKSLVENKIVAAYSDSEILFGLIKPSGEVKVTVNTHEAKRIPLAELPKAAVDLYKVQGYEIWYIDFATLKETKNYLIKVLDKNDSILNELSI